MTDPSRPTSALVVGATGLIGSAVVRNLVGAGWRVTASVRSTQAAEWAEDALTGSFLELVPDLLEPGAIHELVRLASPGVVISTAGLMSASGPAAVRALIDGNVTPIGMLFDACSQAAVPRVITFGSGFEYRPSERAISEADSIGPNTWYGAAKAAASALADHARNSLGLDVCVARPFSVYGPREQLQRLVPDVVTAALRGSRIDMSVGTQVRDYLFVDDLADGIARAASHSGRLPPCLNFSGPIEHNLLDIARTVLDLTGSSSELCPGARAANAADRPVFIGDSSAAHRVLGWHPSSGLRDGLEHTVEWYRTHRSLWDAPA